MRPLLPFGDRAVRLELAPTWRDDVGGRAALGEALMAIDGVEDALVTEHTALVVCRDAISETALERLRDSIEHALEQSSHAPLPPCPLREIEVVYDGEDLDAIAEQLGATRAEVIAWHAGSSLEVSFLGFAPGFAYLRGLDARLLGIPRRASPRPRVTGGAVAIAEDKSVIYPAATPGGWHLLGHAVDHDPITTPWRVGEAVRCRPRVSAPQRDAAPRVETPVRATDRAHVQVDAVAGVTLVVDGLARRTLRSGSPRGGPLHLGMAARALSAAGCDEDDALLERYGSVTLSLTDGPPRRVADEHGAMHLLTPERSLVFAGDGTRRVGYLAIEGGLDVPEILGGRGTLLSIARGGHEGRPLRRGDRIPLGPAGAGARAAFAPTRTATQTAFCARRGPDLVGEGVRIAATLSRTSDRVGTRLTPSRAHHTLQTATAHTSPMLRGAVQAPPSGEFIVLGPDHPVTGGYPVIAVLDTSTCDALFAVPLGREITLEIS